MTTSGLRLAILSLVIIGMLVYVSNVYKYENDMQLKLPG